MDLWRGRRRILIACGVRRVRDDLDSDVHAVVHVVVAWMI